MLTEFRLPKVAEGGGTGTVAKVLVAPGDEVASGAPLVEVETEKTVVEVPSSVDGVVKDVLVKPGDEVADDALILTVESTEGGKASEEAAQPEKPTGPEPENQAGGEPTAAERPPEPEARLVAPSAHDEDLAPAAPAREAAPERAHRLVPAAPSVRRLARELGIEIADVPGTGEDGRISQDDVKAYAKRLLEHPGRGVPTTLPLPDFSRFGPVERRPLSPVRRATAEHLGRSWPLVPQVTQYDEADVTALERFREHFGPIVEAKGGKLTVTAILVKVLSWALGVYPKFNTSLDVERSELVQKGYRHIGVAVDTDRGLLVPVLRDADRKSLVEISVELREIAERARAGKLAREEMEGGSISISNLGGIGGVGFSPIVNAPEVAILGVSRTQLRPVFVGDTVEPRRILPLSLSYDHRVIDGAEAARFLRKVAEALEEPLLMTLEG